MHVIVVLCVCVFRSQWLLQSNSAESVAMGLLRQFEGLQLPAASELEWLVPEHDAPQKVRTRLGCGMTLYIATFIVLFKCLAQVTFTLGWRTLCVMVEF